MDLDLLRTFLEISSAGTLVKAAERLHLTQATVSARLKGLEEELSVRLFVRNKSGAQLTAEGKALVPHATRILRSWQQATAAVAALDEEAEALSLGGEFTLWSAVLLNWLVALRRSKPRAILRTHVDTPARLLDAVQSGSLDLAILYSPLKRPGITSSLVLEEELVAVTTHADGSGLSREDYVYVDWGPDFAAAHDRAFPGLRLRSSYVGLGPLALRFLLQVGGAGYFRTRAVEPYLCSGQLFPVVEAPRFSFSLYAVSSERSHSPITEWAMTSLSEAAQMPAESWA
jgi:LysR family transcriptional regulator, flagellar master operon regulator